MAMKRRTSCGRPAWPPLLPCAHPHVDENTNIPVTIVDPETR